MLPFAKTQAERLANGDPRLSLAERYGSRAGYVAAVETTAANATADASEVLKSAAIPRSGPDHRA